MSTQTTTTAAGDARWCDLPEDLLSEVCSRLASTVVRVRFAAVCRSWRDTSSRQPTAAPAVPLLLLSQSPRRAKKHLCGPDDGWTFRVPNSAANKWLVGSHDGGWVAACDDRVLVVVNLFTGAEVGLSRKQSTTISSTTLPTVPTFCKIIFSEDPTSSNGCMLAAIIRGRFRIGLCRVGCPEGEWTTCKYREAILDIAFCNGVLYGLTFDNTLVKFETGMNGDGTPVAVITATHRLAIQSSSIPIRGCNIFELHGELSMVVRTRRFPDSEPTFRVFKLVDSDTDQYCKYRWEEVTSFGDCALFLDLNCCKAVRVPVGAEHHGLERNHMYYFDAGLMEKKLPGEETYSVALDNGEHMYRKEDQSITYGVGKTGYHLMGFRHYASWLHPPSL